MGNAEDIKRSDLIKAAKEIDELGFDTHPNLKGKPDEIRNWLSEAAELLEPDDFENLSEETNAVLNAMGFGEDEPDADPEDETDENDANETDDEEGEEMKEETKKAPAKKAPKKEAPAKAAKITKEVVSSVIIDDQIDEGKTPEQLRKMIATRPRLADLKALVAEEPAFKELRKRLDEFSGMQGPRQLKAEMEKCLPKVKVDKADTSLAEKKAPKSTPVKKSKASGEKKGPSNKFLVYQSWKKSKEKKTAEELHVEIEERVKLTTIRGWLHYWAKGDEKWLPAGV